MADVHVFAVAFFLLALPGWAERQLISVHEFTWTNGTKTSEHKSTESGAPLINFYMYRAADGRYRANPSEWE